MIRYIRTKDPINWKTNEVAEKVFLDNKYVGDIFKVTTGYQYFPLYSKTGGEIMAKISDVRKSLADESTQEAK